MELKTCNLGYGERPDYEDLKFHEVDGVWKWQKHDPVTFIHADNMQFLRWARDNMMRGHWHIGIVDPPYGVDVTKMKLGKTSAENKKIVYERGDWDGEVPSAEYWELMKYCCRELIVWGGNYFSNFIPPGRCFYTWSKKVTGLDFADHELALTTIDSNARIISLGRNQRAEDDGEKRHDTQKPVYLYDFIHLDQSLRGKKVLDTHGGSFSHAVAAFRNGVNLTIMDKCESYYLAGIENYKRINVKGRLQF